MRLVIDCGNTCVKVAVFADKDTLLCLHKWEKPTGNQFEEVLQAYAIQSAIVCSVVPVKDEWLMVLTQNVPYVLHLNHHTPLPIVNGYKTPHTLGYDRLAVVAGAHALHPNTPALVIDAGTAITYELLTEDGVYRGGNIAPGATMRLQAMHHFTHKLPLLSLQEMTHQLMGNDTQSAMLMGVVQGIVFEIEGYIAALKEKYPNLLIFLTGGDAFFFESRLKSSIFVSPNLLLLGSHSILEYNEC